jgi:hypothetical protein
MRWKFSSSVVLAMLLVSLATSAAVDATTLQWQVVSSGGSSSTSGVHKLSSTVGQIIGQQGSSGVHKMIHGFQQNFSTVVPCLCGDADGSGSFDISDVVYLIGFIFSGGSTPNPICLGDADGSGSIDISDAVYLISYIFSSGPAPHCP